MYPKTGKEEKARQRRRVILLELIPMPRNGKKGNGHKQHSEETKELARARVAAGESLSRVARELGIAKSTLHSWLTQADRDGHQEAREDQKQRFIRQAWESVFKAVTCGDKRMSFLIENADKIDDAIEAVAKAEDLTGKQRAEILKILGSLASIPLKDLAIYIGTIYDKIALASGDVTQRSEQRGEVTQRYEYDITQRIVNDPEARALARNLFRRAVNPDLGRGRAE